MRFSRSLAVALWAAVSIAVPAAAPASRDEEAAASLEALRQQDLRVATVAFRLATKGVELCRRHDPLAGIVLHDAAQYSAALRPVAIRQFGLGDGPSLSVVVPGSPAALAGLRADDALVAIGGATLVDTEGGRRGSYEGVGRATATLGAALGRGVAKLSVRRDGRLIEAEVRPAEGCASEVQVIPSGEFNASADGRYVQLTSAIVGYVASDDELAVVIGHELAHNILGHRATLDAAGVGTGLFSKFGHQAAKIRATEIEADRLGLLLMARAGYDVEAAPAFWRRFGREHGAGIFADATHPGWKKREAMLRATINELRAK